MPISISMVLRTDSIKFITGGIIEPSRASCISITCTSIMASDNEEDGVDTTERDEAETDSDVLLVSKRKAKAFVWKYFNFEMI